VLFLCILFAGCSTIERVLEGEGSQTTKPPQLTEQSTPNPIPDSSNMPEETISPSATPLAEEVVLTYEELVHIAVVGETRLIASPLHPSSFLPDSTVTSGSFVQLVGMDKNSAWLLVLHKNILGWIPTISANIGIGSSNSSVVSVADINTCTSYLGAINLREQMWESNIEGSVEIQGFLYKSSAESNSEDIGLTFLVEETGQEYSTDLFSVSLAEGGQLLEYTFEIQGLVAGNHVRYKLYGLDQRRTPFHASIFSYDCSDSIAAAPGNTPIAGQHSPIPTMAIITLHIVSTGGPQITPSPIRSQKPPSSSVLINGIRYPTWEYCSDAKPSIIQLGDFAYVNPVPPTPNNMREDANKGSAKIGQIPIGDKYKIKILDGPKCANGWVWWYVKFKDLFGWTAEGDDYWLLPFLEERYD